MKALLALLLLVSLPALAGEPQAFHRGSWQALRQEHAGKPVIVHFWGVTCGPCLTELPRWGAFIGAGPKADIVMVSADPAVIDPASVAEVLAKADCDAAESWVFADPFTEKLNYEIDPDWGGELPYTMLIAADGGVTKIIGAVDFARLADWAARQGGGRGN